MSDPIDLEQRRRLKDTNPFLVIKDDDGPWFKYGIEYEAEGVTFVTHIWAKSMEDAQKQLSALKETGKIYGQICEEIAE